MGRKKKKQHGLRAKPIRSKYRKKVARITRIRRDSHTTQFFVEFLFLGGLAAGTTSSFFIQGIDGYREGVYDPNAYLTYGAGRGLQVGVRVFCHCLYGSNVIERVEPHVEHSQAF